MKKKLRRTLFGALAVLLLFQAPSAGASESDEPQHPPWTELLPPLPVGAYVQSGSPLCPAGQTTCVDVVIREMRRRFNPLARSCNHDAVFALTYLRTTEEYRRAVSDPNFFEDTPFVNHQDVIFADIYFRAYDNWHRKRGPVPPAWEVAFEAADSKAVPGMGSLLLGMSAHVNRDLPFVLEQIGIVQPDGRSRKPDHDQVDQFLVKVIDDAIPEGARRFDPTMDDLMIDGTTLEETTAFQLIALWREEAWRNAERLVAARSPLQRALVASEIETTAALKGRLLVQAYRYRQPLTNSSARDAWCAEHWDSP